MNADKNHKRASELRWIGFQSVLTGIVIIFGVGCILFIYFGEETGVQSSSYSTGRGLGILLLGGVWGLWMIVRGVINLIRALSGDEQYAKSVVDVMDRVENRQEQMMRSKVGNGSMHNVMVLLGWVLLFLAVVGAIGVGYLFWTRPRP